MVKELGGRIFFGFFCKMVVHDGLTETLNVIICMKQAEPLLCLYNN